MTSLPIGNLSIDLDNAWSYLKSADREGWRQYEGYLPLVVPRILDVVGDLEMGLTAFVVGTDLERDGNCDAVSQFVREGYELGNHSYSHELAMTSFDRERIELEIDRTEESARRLSPNKMTSFRGPGYSDSPVIRRVLAERGYRLIASPFPSIIGPVSRAYFFTKSQLAPSQRAEKKQMFGKFSDGFGSNRPNPITLDSRRLWVFPVTVSPFARTPIHFSYLLYLAEFSETTAIAYFRNALRLCRATRVAPSLLLHPPDFLGSDDGVGLDFLPGMKRTRTKKLTTLSKLLRVYASYFQVVGMNQHLQTLDPTISSKDVESQAERCELSGLTS